VPVRNAHLIRRTVEAFGKGGKYLWDVSKSKPFRLMYVSGCPGDLNLGDTVLFEAYKKLFSRYSFVHYKGGRVLSIPSRLMRVSGYAVLAGGTLINRWGLSAFTECMNIFNKSYVFGTGVAHPEFWSGNSGWWDTLDQWKPVLQRCDYVGVRGPLSAELLSDIGIQYVEIIGDPVLAYSEEPYVDGASYIPNSIGLNIGQSYGRVWGSEESICEEYVKLATLAKNSDWKVEWFVVWPKDLAITQKAALSSGTRDHIHQIYEDYGTYMTLVKPLSTFVGMKLHAVILATCVYVPSLMLEYRPKCRDYMLSIGQESHNIRTDEFKAEEVWDIVNSWNANRQLLSKALYQSIKPLRDRQLAKAKALMEAWDGCQ
jgi:hypothetical protein